MNWAGVRQSILIGPGFVYQQLSQHGVVLERPVHMSDEPGKWKALLRGAETDLTEKSKGAIRIEFAATQVRVGPCMQVKLTLSMGRREINTRG